MYERALVLAARAHAGQMRKGTDTPYITHPLHVATILERFGFDEEIAVAGLLHDVVEDAGVDPGEIRRQFGGRVASLVTAVTEDKVDSAGREIPWIKRKQAQLDHLGVCDTGAVALKAADALHNISTLTTDLEIHGVSVWRRFNANREETLWYTMSLAARVSERLGGHPITVAMQVARRRLVEVSRVL